MARNAADEDSTGDRAHVGSLSGLCAARAENLASDALGEALGSHHFAEGNTRCEFGVDRASESSVAAVDRTAGK